ncbi:AN1-type zinc finger protein 3-like [Labrus mixtus]|uniref:AN1-type zinc finger protein 3-like n=1 Tax=Labrus mixtus TaxID=508554 RepID=UPI0029BFB938|nr:AN1-type zinc finger protein 3-like [Labrus mixtus]
MGDTSERSKAPSLPPRCPCGFWGSSKTMNLCSKCFADIQKKQPGEDCTSKPIQSTGSSSQSPVFSSETSSSSSQSPLSSSPPSSSEQPSAEESSPTFPSMREGVSSTETAQGTLCTPTKRPRESASGSESEATPEKRPRTDEQQQQEEEEEEGSSEEARGTPKQKNRRRCYRCQTKLELVQQELGSCRCGYVFCMLHRLPEQHDCLFDHLGRGREEAVLKMVKLDRKVGRSCQRIGEECS